MGDDVASRKALHPAERRRRPIPGHLSHDPADTHQPRAYPQVEITDEMEQSFVDYAMSVIVSRALPDVRDGLKPVQRRIIYSMFENNITAGSAHPQVRQGRR